jgi:hypothetical protein
VRVTWLRAHRVDVALVALVLALAAPILQDLKAQQASRLALTAAVWDDGTLRIDDYPLGIDRAEHDGHLYSDKAPGQPFFAIPAYAAYRAVGGEPARHFRNDGNLGLWTVTLWSSVLPTVVLVLLVRRAADDTEPGTGLAVAAITYASTLLLPFSSLLFGHALSACLAFAGWYVVRRGDPSTGALVASGALLGGAVLAEYTLVLAAVAVGLHVVWRCGGRALWFVAGGTPALVALLAYQWATFDSPFAFSYAHSGFGEAARAAGLEDQDPALVANAVRVLVGERGLAVVTPLVIVGLVGMVMLVRRTPLRDRSAPLAAAASAVSLIVLQMAWSNPTGGDSPGPRYATAAAAFVAPGVAVAWVRWPRLTRALAAIGALVMLAATWTEPLEARDSRGAIGIWLRKVAEGDWALTVYEQALGSWAVVLLPAVGLAAGLGVVAAQRRRLARDASAVTVP